MELKEYEARIEELRASEKLLATLNETLEMKLKKTEELRAQRSVILIHRMSYCCSLPFHSFKLFFKENLIHLIKQQYKIDRY